MPLEISPNFSFDVKFHDLYEREGLLKIDQKFNEFLKEKNPEIAKKFFDLKENHKSFSKLDQSAVLIDVSRFLEDFLVQLFAIEKENAQLKKRHENLKNIYQIRRDFVQRNIAKKFKAEDASEINGLKILQNLGLKYDDIDELEENLSHEIFKLLDRDLSVEEKEKLEILTLYSIWAFFNKDGKDLHRSGSLFILPQKIDHQNLVNRDVKNSNRDGFDLTDKGFGLNRVLAEANYCIFCHKQGKDSCRSGLKEKDSQDFKKDPLNVELHGCPLDEKISEMNLLKTEGFSVAAFSMAIIDNPMIAGTGHRICNDCMKSCIYQKQDPVDIPQIETRILRDVLSLPYGFEIYSLLTRWNPLNLELSLPKADSGKKILICGLGPAGYSLAHNLLNDGHAVVAIDGLKIEPLNAEISGIDEFGNRKEFRPIKFLDEIYEPLSKRLIHGFGGVAEYGITVRFDKNFLKIIRLLLERRNNFRMFGGIRFGSTITDEVAFKDYGFDHVALCIGAGRPNIINLKNNFAKGIRSASDFLMSLQLTGSFKEELFTNLQIRMPIAVIGGGLTAVDTACEAGAYYIVQIRKFAKRLKKIGKEKLFQVLNEEEKIIAEEFLNHAKELENGILPSELLKKLGGVKILYRKKIQDSPAYRLNHQELNKAFEEGVEFIENIAPLEAELDQFCHIENLKCENGQNFSCRSLLVAAGTTPNISPKLEDKLNFEIEGKYFAEIFEDKKHHEITHTPKYNVKSPNFSVITKIDETSGKAVSFFGDLHPNFEGNVVKAMASAKFGYVQIGKILERCLAPKEPGTKGAWHQKINEEFLAKIEKINRLSPNIIEVVVKAPLVAKQSQVGHIFRLQNYHALAGKVGDQLLAMEGVTITALEVDKSLGIIKGMMVETGGSSSLIKNFKAGEPCIFMGPSGKPTELPQNKIAVLVGGGRGNQALVAIAKAYKANGCKVFYFAGYRKNSHMVQQKEMENVSDILVCSVEEEEPNLNLSRAQDSQFKGTVIEALENYFTKNPQKIERIFAIGNDRLMAGISNLRNSQKLASLSQAEVAIASLNAPMQCMLKGVCSQCLQKRKNENGEMEYFYSCADQDQNSDRFDFQHLHWRCEQNSLAEKVSKLWIEVLEAS